jgi:hypothetical protein
VKVFYEFPFENSEVDFIAWFGLLILDDEISIKFWFDWVSD